MKRKFFIGILGACMCASLIGCGSKKEVGTKIDTVLVEIKYDSDSLDSFKSKIGSPSESISEQNEYTYNNMSFLGINGNVTIKTNADGTIHHCTWTSDEGNIRNYDTLKDYCDKNYTFSQENALGLIYHNGDVKYQISYFDDDKTIQLSSWK